MKKLRYKSITWLVQVFQIMLLSTWLIWELCFLESPSLYCFNLELAQKGLCMRLGGSKAWSGSQISIRHGNAQGQRCPETQLVLFPLWIRLASPHARNVSRLTTKCLTAQPQVTSLQLSEISSTVVHFGCAWFPKFPCWLQLLHHHTGVQVYVLLTLPLVIHLHLSDLHFFNSFHICVRCNMYKQIPISIILTKLLFPWLNTDWQNQVGFMDTEARFHYLSFHLFCSGLPLWLSW